jgi:hypothetical protein
MDTDSNYFAFSEDSIEKLIKSGMKEEYEKDKFNFLPSESKELHLTFQVDVVRFDWDQRDKRKPGLFKVETTKDIMISLCSKMYCAWDITEEKIKFSCKGIQSDGNNVNYQKFHNILFNKHNDQVLKKGFRYIDGYMKSYEQNKKGLSYAYHKE